MIELNNKLPNNKKPLTTKILQEDNTFINSRYFIGRHGDAIYELNESIVHGPDPLGQFDILKQPIHDLSDEGVRSTTDEAHKFFNNFNPEIDEIALFSSSLTRSRQTAAIYLEMAKKRGFVIKIVASKDNDGHVDLLDFEEFNTESVIEEKRRFHRGKISEALYKHQGGQEVRTLQPLSLDNIGQMLIEFVFHPQDYMNKIVDENKDKIPAEYREIWSQARKVIEGDNKDSWGGNFLKHSEQLQKLFDEFRQNKKTIPHFFSVKDMYEKNFRNILRIMARYDDAINSYEALHPLGKKIRILGFSHENQLLYFLNKEFNKVGVDKGSLIGFKIFPDENGDKYFTSCLPEKPYSPQKINLPNSPH